MAAGPPDDKFVEVEFTAGVWTDVTGYVDWSAGLSTTFGRPGKYVAVSASTMSLTLDNTDGRFSPQRQVLADGTTTHPYWPNVLPRKRIRYGWIISATRYYRFTGYVRGWPPIMKDSAKPRITINAVDRLEALSRTKLSTAVTSEISPDAPLYYWPLTDSGDSGIAVEASGGPPLTPIGTPQWGVDGPGSSNGTGVALPVSQFLDSRITNASITSTGAFEMWINPGSTLGSATIAFWSDQDGGGAVTFLANAAGHPQVQIQPSGLTVTGGASIYDAGWHHLVASWAASVTTFYVDGASVGTAAAAPGAMSRWGVELGGAGYQVSYGQVALYNTALSAARVAAHALAGRSGLGETVDARIARLLGYVGLTGADWSLDTSTVVLSSYGQEGQDVLSAIQAAVDSEGGGAAFYVDTTGVLQFANRNARLGTAAVINADQAAVLDGSTWQPAFDADTLVNQENATRSTASGSASTQTAKDQGSITAYGLFSDDFTSYAAADTDVLYNAQERVASQSDPGFRAGQITVDMFTAQTSQYVTVGTTGIGARARVTNLPAGAAPASQADLIIEGWADSASDQAYKVTFDTSPADNPAPFLIQDATYGILQAEGQTLNVALTNSATTVVIATTAGKATFSTNSVYPLKITVGAERIQLNSVPGGSSSPQTFTGVTRGVDGTTAAAQASGSTVTLAPLSTLTL